MEPRRFERLYGVVGYPLGHTLSPALHNWAFSLSRQAGVYLPFAKKPEELSDFVAAVRTLPLHGVSVTLPHKTAIIPLLDGVSERAARIGAVNTLYWENDRLLGENTDIQGAAGLLRGKTIRSALVLGGGGAALTILDALEEVGAERVIVAMREPRKFARRADRPNPEIVAWEHRAECMDESLDLVVNTTPIGMAGHSPEASPLQAYAWRRVATSCTAFDLVYNPLTTRFLREAGEAGLRLQDGLDFFTAQGLAQFRLWTGLQLPAGAARVLLEQVLLTRTEHESPRQGKSA